MIDPNSAKPMISPTTLVTTNTRLENSRIGSTGSAARRSAHTNAASSTTPTTPSPTISGEPQPWLWPSVVSSTIALSPAASSAIPR